jgi:hypothetical protein
LRWQSRSAPELPSEKDSMREGLSPSAAGLPTQKLSKRESGSHERAKEKWKVAAVPSKSKVAGLSEMSSALE